MKTLSKRLAFSLIELLISLIVISCITAAFTPVITKKLKNTSVALNAASSEITTECKEKFSESCKLCTKSYCIQCELSNCEIGKYTENKTCSCKDCSSLFSDCLECSASSCSKCKQTHYVKEGKCEICPTDKICDGINAYDKSYCDNPAAGFFCEGTTLKKCKEKYNSHCATCDHSVCKSCDSSYFISGNTCKHCPSNCNKCRNENYCDECEGTAILDTNTHLCTKTCNEYMPNCLFCSNSTTCTLCMGGYYINSSKNCSSCTDIPNCNRCSNGSTCTKCNKEYYVNSSNKCSQCTISNCAQCDRDGTCLACNQGFHVSSDKKSCVDNDNKFNCSDSNFMRIGNLCVTRRNMGDSAMLPIAASVNVVQASGEYCYPQTSKCCWKGKTAWYPSCDSNYGGYDGCTRTVCSYDAAKEICSKFNYGGKIWRLPTADELASWLNYSLELNENGLLLCDCVGGYLSALCPHSANCKGAHESLCLPDYVWSGTLQNALSAYTRDLHTGLFNFSFLYTMNAASVRCVTEME